MSIPGGGLNKAQQNNFPQLVKMTVDDTDVDVYVVPILKNQPNYLFFRQRIHVTALSNFISILFLVVNLSLVYLVMTFGNLVSVMILSLIVLPISFFHIYGSFRWKRACLIPFMILLLFYITHQIVFFFFFFYVFVNKRAYFHIQISDHMSKTFFVESEYVILGILYSIMPFLGLGICCLKITILNYEFIGLVDSLIKKLSMRKENRNDCSTSDSLNEKLNVPKRFNPSADHEC
uniref:G_PROTEIN_RECEP_F1_2 domain-containing protein n=1 Tax=Rhabditophanes sp. KR3021 TaxID=114890 RepID=A0AC35TMK7_9BILA